MNNQISYNKFEPIIPTLPRNISKKMKKKRGKILHTKLGEEQQKIKHMYTNVPVKKIDKRILTELESKEEIYASR